MDKRKFILLACLTMIIMFAPCVNAKGIFYKTQITNVAKVLADNYYLTNISGRFTSMTSFMVGEIHGIMELASTNTNVFMVPSQTYYFWYNVTNKANTSETNLNLVLTNFHTNYNAACGNWTLSLLELNVIGATTNTNVLFTTTSHAFSGYCSVASTQHVSPDSIYRYSVYIKSGSNAQPGAWLNITNEVRILSTNVASYTSRGNNYGGKAAYFHNILAKISSPSIMLSKNITRITNIYTGGYELMPGCEIMYRITFSNSGFGPGRNLRIVDILPSRDIMLSNGSGGNGFTLSNFSVNFSNARYFNGLTWNYNPLQVWDSNVIQIRFDAGTNIFPIAAKGVIQYKIRIR